MENENMNMLPASVPTPEDTAAQENPPALIKKIGGMTYIVRVHFSTTSKETFSDKVKRLLRNEVRQLYSRTMKYAGKGPLSHASRASSPFRGAFSPAPLESLP